MKYFLSLLVFNFAVLSAYHENENPVIYSKKSVIIFYTNQGTFLQIDDCMWKIEEMSVYGSYPD